jgi:hypothetical protein
VKAIRRSDLPELLGGYRNKGLTRRLSVAIVMMLVCGMTGCGASAPDLPKLAAVKGVVTLNGSPLANAIVEFYPDVGAPSSGKTDAEGKFALKYSQGQDGAIIGNHRVKVTETVELAGGGGDAPPPKVAPKPPRSFDWADQVSVTPGENTIDFPLTGK